MSCPNWILTNFGRYTLGKIGGVHVDLPPEYASLEMFNTTLGHKANHAFHNNAVYVQFSMHPVLGAIFSLVAVKDIKAGAEVFTNYGYSTKHYENLGFSCCDIQCAKVLHF